MKLNPLSNLSDCYQSFRLVFIPFTDNRAVFMPQGQVKWFKSDKGYGFIAQENGSDLFVHHSEVQTQYLKEGQQVEFEIGQGPKGPCAVNVRVI